MFEVVLAKKNLIHNCDIVEKVKLRYIFRSTEMLGKNHVRKQAKTPDQHVLTFHFRKNYSEKYQQGQETRGTPGPRRQHLKGVIIFEVSIILGHKGQGT